MYVCVYIYTHTYSQSIFTQSVEFRKRCVLCKRVGPHPKGFLVNDANRYLVVRLRQLRSHYFIAITHRSIVWCGSTRYALISSSSSSCRAGSTDIPDPLSAYHSSLLASLQGYIPYPHIAAVCMFELVVLLLLGHMRWSIGVHH